MRSRRVRSRPGAWLPNTINRTGDNEPVIRVGKKTAGAKIDGRTWKEQPLQKE
jgi:hypothetical protein